MLIKVLWIDTINFFKLLAYLINPMDNVIAFMKKNGVRPLELLRSFDKENNWTLTKGAFVAHLKVSDKIFSVFLSVDLYIHFNLYVSVVVYVDISVFVSV